MRDARAELYEVSGSMQRYLDRAGWTHVNRLGWVKDGAYALPRTLLEAVRLQAIDDRERCGEKP